MIPTDRIRALPKVELHCHLEGTMRTATLVELAAANGVELPAEDPATLFDYDDLTGFLSVFWLVQAALATPEDWARLAYEATVDGAAHGLVHRETFVTPSRHLLAGQDLGAILAAIDEGLAAGERDTGATTRVIVDIDREFGPAVALDHVGRLVALRRAGAPGADRVIGLGMDSTERGIDPASFLASYDLARSAGLRLTAHQGENSPAAAVAAAVDVLGCERIDHGISVVADPDLTARLADRRLPFTVCPNANVRINPDLCADLADHAFPVMRDAGLLVTMNTDDPALVGLDLTQEYATCAATFGLTWDDLVALALDAADAAWLDDADRRRIRAAIAAA